MLPLLLFISLLLHLVSFIIMRSLYLKVHQADESEKRLKQTITEMEELLILYLQEMKEENNYLLERLEPGNRYPDKGKNVLSKVDEPLPIKHPLTPDLPSSGINASPTKGKPDNNYMPPMPTEQQDTWEQSMAGKVLALHEQGETIEEIARKLDSGKTEIQLLLKFHQKNN